MGQGQSWEHLVEPGNFAAAKPALGGQSAMGLSHWQHWLGSISDKRTKSGHSSGPGSSRCRTCPGWVLGWVEVDKDSSAMAPGMSSDPACTQRRGMMSQQVNRNAWIYARGAKPLHFNYKTCVHIFSLVPRVPRARARSPPHEALAMVKQGQVVAAVGLRLCCQGSTPGTGCSHGAYAGETWLVETEEVSVLPADVSSSPRGFLPQQRVVIMQLRNWEREKPRVSQLDTRQL